MVHSISDKILKSIVEACMLPDIKFRHNTLLKLYRKHTTICTLLYSIPLSNFRLPSFNVRTNNKKPNNSYVEVLSTMLYFIEVKDFSTFKQVLKDSPILYQQITQLLFLGTFLKKIPEYKLLEGMDDILVSKEIVKSLPIPRVYTVSEFVLEGMSKKDVDISYPLVLVSLSLKYEKSVIHYLHRKGNKVTSSLLAKLTRNNIVRRLGSVDKSCIFVTNNINGKIKEKDGAIIVKGGKDTITKLYRGLPNPELNLAEDIEVPETNTVYIHNEAELLLALTDSKVRHSNYLITTSGIIKVEYSTYIKVVNVVDFWLDDDFNPIGLKVMLGNDIFTIKIKPSILTGLSIEDLQVKVKVRYFLDKIVSVVFYRMK